MLIPSSDRFQYKTLPLDASSLSEAKLNEFGYQGWLLVSTLPNIVLVRCMQEGRTAPQSSEPMLLSIKQVSHRLGMSISSVYRLVRGGFIQSIKVGRLIRIQREELDLFTQRMSEG
jgi:excisionase family DNA binding protein